MVGILMMLRHFTWMITPKGKSQREVSNFAFFKNGLMGLWLHLQLLRQMILLVDQGGMNLAEGDQENGRKLWNNL